MFFISESRDLAIARHVIQRESPEATQKIRNVQSFQPAKFRVFKTLRVIRPTVFVHDTGLSRHFAFVFRMSRHFAFGPQKSRKFQMFLKSFKIKSSPILDLNGALNCIFDVVSKNRYFFRGNMIANMSFSRVT